MALEHPEVDLSPLARAVVGELGASPCAVVAAAIRRGDSYVFGAGQAGNLSFDEGAAPAEHDTPFDLASLTKPVFAVVFARLERARRIQRSELLGDVLPSVASSRSARVPLDLFLAHRAGLDAHRSLFAPLAAGGVVDRAAALFEAADARREGCEGAPPVEGFPPVYSDLGYWLVGEAIAAREGAPLDAVLARELATTRFGSIRSARRWEAEEPERFQRVAPTEVVAWRGGVVRGRVHDENAFAMASDATCGHAGLFGDARAIANLGIEVLEALAGRSEWLSPDDLSPLIRARPGGSLLAGFDAKSGDAPSAGTRFGPRTFGHLGFTGTSVWIDRDADLVGVLLTNRVHPTRAHLAIRAARPLVYDGIFDAMSSR